MTGKFKKLKRLCINPAADNDPKMHTLYECRGKNGTTSTTILWFMEEPKKGAVIWGIDANSHYSPYMSGHAFRYAKFTRFCIDDVYEDGYVICRNL